MKNKLIYEYNIKLNLLDFHKKKNNEEKINKLLIEINLLKSLIEWCE